MPSATHKRLFREAIAAGEQRDYQRAAELLLTVISETDEIPQAFLYLGRSYHALGRYERAIRFLRYFAEIMPREEAGHFFLGRAYFASGFYRDARYHLKIALEIDPDNAQVLGLLGTTYIKERRPEIACEYLSRAVELDPENATLYNGYLNTLSVEAIRRFRRGELDLSRQMLKFLLERGFDTPMVRLHLAACYREMHRFEDALEQYNVVVKMEPEDILLRFQRAELLLRLDRRDDADRELSSLGFETSRDEPVNPAALNRSMAIEAFQQGRFRRAVDFALLVMKELGSDHPACDEMHLLVGESYRNLESFEKAANHFRRVIEHDRTRIEPKYGLAMTLWQRGMFEEMLQELKRISRIHPEDHFSSYYTALCYARLNREPDTTVRLLLTELEENDTDPFLNTALGKTFARVNRVREAEESFRRALDLSESHRPAYLGLAELYIRENREEEAAELYHTYFEHFPADREPRKRYIQLLVGLERYEIAVDEIQRHLPYEGESQGLRRLLAFCYRKAEKHREAAIIYRQLLTEHPKDERYLRALCFSLERSGNRGTAVELLRHAMDYIDASVSMRLIYGVLLYKENRLEESLELFRSVLDSAPNDWRAYRNIGMIYRKRGVGDMAERYLERSEEYRAKQISDVGRP